MPQCLPYYVNGDAYLVGDIMSKSKSEEIVDARHLLVVTLRRSGYYPGMIAERLHISGRAVRKMIGSFRSRADNSPGLEMCRRRVEARRNGNGTNADNLEN